eukprot:8324295-Pyramimonas_sp.AAC.1
MLGCCRLGRREGEGELRGEEVISNKRTPDPSKGDLSWAGQRHWDRGSFCRCIRPPPPDLSP